MTIRPSIFILWIALSLALSGEVLYQATTIETEMAGVLVLPAVGAREKRERYRRIRIPKYVLDSFIETNTVQQSTLLNVVRNRKKVRRSDAQLGRAA
jgi:hypothetical protein